MKKVRELGIKMKKMTKAFSMVSQIVFFVSSLCHIKEKYLLLIMHIGQLIKKSRHFRCENKAGYIFSLCVIFKVLCNISVIRFFIEK